MAGPAFVTERLFRWPGVPKPDGKLSVAWTSISVPGTRRRRRGSPRSHRARARSVTVPEGEAVKDERTQFVTGSPAPLEASLKLELPAKLSFESADWA